jgi:hypothetical protein
MLLNKWNRVRLLKQDGRFKMFVNSDDAIQSKNLNVEKCLS